MKIFIAHYTPLVERKKFQVDQLKKFGLEAEFIEEFDREKLSEFDLAIFDTKQVSLPKVSLSIKHHNIFKLIYEQFDYALILEDDAILHENFHDLMTRCISELPNDWDAIFIGGCCDLHLPSTPDKLLYLKSNYPCPYGMGSTRGAASFMVSKQGAAKILYELQQVRNNYQKIDLPVDIWLNIIFRKYNMRVYWAEPYIAWQGTCTGLFVSSLNNV